MFALIDCNNFYASCERLFAPKWQKRPLVVLSNNDGCVIARSNEAKALGIPMGAPHFQWRELIQREEVVVCSSNFALYGDISQRIMQILAEYTPSLQVYSIDEAFLSVPPTFSHEQAVAIRNTILQWTGIPVSVGIAVTKTLAKVAAKRAKARADGVFMIGDEPGRLMALQNLPVEEVWGIGRRMGRTFNGASIYSAMQLCCAPDSLIRKLASVVAVRVAHELRGISSFPLQELPPKKQTIRCSRSFGRPISCKEQLYEAVATFASAAAEKLRRQESRASMVTLLLENGPYLMRESRCDLLRLVLTEPTNYTPALITAAKRGVDQLFQPDCAYRKAGVLLEGLSSTRAPDQLTLFSQAKRDRDPAREQRLMSALDAVNRKWGRNTLHPLAEGITKEWKMKQENQTAHYTTNWDQLLTIRI